MSEGFGGPAQQPCKSCGAQTIASEEYANGQVEIIEEPNSSSFLGLTRPDLVPYEERVIDAMNRGAITKRLFDLISLILVVITLALVAATFAGVPASGLITYAKWLSALLVPLFTMALGYYFGSAQQSGRRKG